MVKQQSVTKRLITNIVDVMIKLMVKTHAKMLVLKVYQKTANVLNHVVKTLLMTVFVLKLNNVKN